MTTNKANEWREMMNNRIDGREMMNNRIDGREMMNNRIDGREMMNIPREIILMIAADSYRTRQLMRLTCRRYRDQLEGYDDYDEILTGLSVPVSIGRSVLIDAIRTLITDGSLPTNMYMRHIVVGWVPYVSMIVSVHKCSSCTGEVIISLAAEAITLCRIAIGFDERGYAANVFGVWCTIIIGAEQSWGDVLRVIADELPELRIQ
jgi:hypothetical protein